MATIKISTVIPEEFTRWINYELYSAHLWDEANIRSIIRPTGMEYFHVNKAGEILWTIIVVNHKYITVESDERYVYLRKGLRVVMKYARLEVC